MYRMIHFFFWNSGWFSEMLLNGQLAVTLHDWIYKVFKIDIVIFKFCLCNWANINMNIEQIRKLNDTFKS